ncbi:carbohydrate sulfotransferase 13-like [Mizuhopecten yessoensis]|uniref:carbohydrate sulfotransferase 13-like n=1 Tax=Mizuhopecten yessoensis TaxID=6573 RepID=UPI000B45C5B0|nr:carbohydrate sulfotransferase 13-like [Mizuhopecten yessoensis]
MVHPRRICRYVLCISCVIGLSVILRNAHMYLYESCRHEDYTTNLPNDVVRPEVRQSSALEPNYDQTVRSPDSHMQLNKLYAKRRKTMLDACAGRDFDPAFRGNSSQNSIKDHFIVDRKHRIIYCAMEKVGSTFWRRLWQILAGLRSAHNPYDIPAGNALGGGQETFKNVFFDEIHTMISTYRSFIFTRHPFSRLFSGYVDKLFSPNPVFWKSLGTYIVSNFREGKKTGDNICGYDVTFREFVKYIIHSKLHNEHRDGHFLPMHDHCRPCQVTYDIIGRMETIVDDTVYIVKSLGFDVIANTLNKTMRASSVSDTIKDQVDILFRYKNKVCISFYIAQKLMWRKFQIRGVISKHSKFPFTREQAGNITEPEYVVAVTNAVSDIRDQAHAEQYRQEAYAEAFSSVDREDMTKLAQILQVDCEIFGYDCSLTSLYHKLEKSQSNFKYFDTDLYKL